MNKTNYIMNRLFDQTNLYEVENRKMLHWIINRLTSEMCLNYFYQWVDIAKSGSKQSLAPDWSQVLEMINKSLPKLIFKHLADVGEKQTIQLIIKNEQKPIIKLLDKDCVISNKSMKRTLINMTSYTPLRMSMIVYDHPTDENKKMRDYVDQFVLRLTIN